MSRAPIRSWRFAAVAVLPLLGGCVGLAALPVLAGGAIAARGVADEDGRVADEAGRAQATAGSTAGVPADPAIGDVGELTAESVLARPPVSAAPGSAAPGQQAPAPWKAFVDYTLERAAMPAAGGSSSVLLEPRPSLEAPRFRSCSASQPAVIIDLDAGTDALDPTNILAAPAGLAESLARLREAGVVVIWLSAQSADRVAAVSGALVSSGLDPQGRDPLLLAMRAGDRKQSLRERAAEDGCIIAIAGDRRGDFDEVFDYLRDPSTASLLDFQLGQGWFLVPPPLG